MTTQKYNPQCNHQEEGDHSIASRMRYQQPSEEPQPLALHTESSPLQQNPQMPITHIYPNDPLPTPQLTNDDSLAGSQDRQRAPFKQSRRCLENRTRTDSFTSETSEEIVDYGSFAIYANPPTDSDNAWSKYKWE